MVLCFINLRPTVCWWSCYNGVIILRTFLCTVQCSSRSHLEDLLKAGTARCSHKHFIDTAHSDERMSALKCLLQWCLETGSTGGPGTPPGRTGHWMPREWRLRAALETPASELSRAIRTIMSREQLNVGDLLPLLETSDLRQLDEIKGLINEHLNTGLIETSYPLLEKMRHKFSFFVGVVCVSQIEGQCCWMVWWIISWRLTPPRQCTSCPQWGSHMIGWLTIFLLIVLIALGSAMLHMWYDVSPYEFFVIRLKWPNKLTSYVRAVETHTVEIIRKKKIK